MRAGLAAMLSVLIVLPAQSQAPSGQHSPFGCSAGAVETDWNRNPPLQIKPLSSLPRLNYAAHEFHFAALGPFVVKIFLAATLSESVDGGPARLHIYAETIDAANDPLVRRDQWWEIEPADEELPNSPDKSSRSFLFDSARIRDCYTQDNCSFADVALATPDPNLPLVVIKFGENLGGANALNWTEASILVDFRPTPPRVLATLDCAYNEGGGACTAPDSAEMLRTELYCDWQAANDDFLCSDNSTLGDGYLDFFLLNDKPAPLRPDVVPTLEDAIHAFRVRGIASPVKVRGIGPVSWIDELKLNSHSKVIILGSAGFFHFLIESDGKLGAATHVEPHPLIVDPNEVSHASSRVDISGWTVETADSFHSRQIYQEKNLRVLQVIAGQARESRGLYWLGVQADETATKFDAVQLVGGGRYASCGNFDTPENVVSVGKVTKPFSAQVGIQPANWSSEADQSLYGWDPIDSEDEVQNCIRSGKIIWKDGKFVGGMDSGECGTREDPKDIQVAPDGRIALKSRPPRSKREKAF